MTNRDEQGFLAALAEASDDRATRAAYADWLDEHDRPHEALEQREKAGLSEAWYRLRRKSDGLYSECSRSGTRKPVRWSAKGKMWRKLSDLQAHLTNFRSGKQYGDNTDWNDLEVVVIELRMVPVTVLPVVHLEHHRYGRHVVTIGQPPSTGETE